MEIKKFNNFDKEKVNEDLEDMVTNIPEELSYDTLEFDSGGDGVEFEIWKHKTTGLLYKVPIEIVRDFAGAEVTRSEWAAKFGE